LDEFLNEHTDKTAAYVQSASSYRILTDERPSLAAGGASDLQFAGVQCRLLLPRYSPNGIVFRSFAPRPNSSARFVELDTDQTSR
jgi:hypothetical protein